MNKLDPDTVLDGFFDSLSTATMRVLLLDYDGTLAPFRKIRDEAVPYAGLSELLDKIQDAERTRIVIISGRSVDDILPLLGLRNIPEIWGCHGWERLDTDGTKVLLPLDSRSDDFLSAVSAWADRRQIGKAFERKHASAAFHWRGAGHRIEKDLRTSLENEIVPLALEKNIVTLPFDGGIEFLAPGKNKGTVMMAILEESPPGSAIAYLGDDMTDEDAFEVLSGSGLSVLVRKDFRPTKADIWISPPAELFSFLGRWLERCGVRDES